MPFKNQKIIAIICSLVSASFFSFADVIIKFVSVDLNAYHIAFWLDIFALVTVLIFSKQLGGLKQTLQSNNKHYHLLRAISITIGYIALIVSLTKMPIADTYSIMFTAPIIGIILAALILKEKIERYHTVSLALGFIGILIILRPGIITINTDLVYPLLSAVMFSIAMVFGRKLPQTETKLSFALYNILVTLIVTGILTINDFRVPSINAMLLLASAGFMSGFAVLLAGVAYSKAAATVVAPFEYIRMVWGVLFGFIIFKDIFEWAPAIGSIFIIISGLYLISNEKKASTAI